MRRLVVALCLLVLFAMVAVPIAAAQSGEDIPSPTFIPPVETDFEGGSQYNVVGPLGISVSTRDLGLRVFRGDLLIPGCEVPLQASFTYDLNRINEDSPYGRGWWFEYAAGYAELPDGTLFIGPIRGANKQYRPGSDGLTQTEPGRYQLHLSDGTIYYFDNPEHKQVTKIEGRNGGYLLMTYQQGLLTEISDRYDRSLSLTYSRTAGAYRLVRIADTNAHPDRIVEYSYDSSGLLTGVTDPSGRTTQYEYTPSSVRSPSALEKIIAPDGNWAAINYASTTNEIVSHVSSPMGAVDFRSEYSGVCPTNNPTCPLGTVTAVTDIVDGERRTMLYYYDSQQELELVREAERDGTSFGYDADGNRTVMTDPNQNQTKYKYDDDGNLLEEIDPLGRTTSYTYDQATGQVATITDPLGSTTAYQYDTEGHLIAYTDPLSQTTAIEYDCCHPIAVTNPLNQTIHLGYDSFGYLNTVYDDAGVSTTLEYSPRGELMQQSDGLGNSYYYDHDIMGRTTAITDPNGEIHRFTYDSVGRMSTYISPERQVIYYTYDTAGRPIQVTDALGKVAYVWDTSDNITAIIDGEGNQDKLTYDYQGRITSRADGLGRATSFEHDDAGNMVLREDPLGQGTGYTYNAANELEEVLYPDGITVTYQYDPAGNTKREANADVSIEYTYDAANRLTSVVMGGKTIDYTYNAAGRRSTMTDPDGYLTTYDYDAGGRLTSVTHQIAGTTSYHYDAAGRLSWVEHPNGVTSTYTFDPRGQIESIVHKDSGGTVLDSYSYTYDGNGNRTSVTDLNGTTTYFYDQRNQLTGAAYPNSTSSSYTYDLAGNRIAKNGSPSSYDSADQLISAGSTSFGWDSSGNMVSETAPPYQTDYQYDHENRLVQAYYYDGTDVTYRYYPDGRLWSRTGRDGQTSYFYYDGPNLLLETDNLGNPVNRYINGLAVDSWLGMVHNGQSYSYIQDGMNSIVGLTGGDQSLAASYRYDPWGQILSETGSVNNPLRFTGRYWDEDAELYRYRARLYDPESGRFLTRDPLGPLQVHQPYAYAENNPTSYIDPLGLDTWACSGGQFGAGVLIGFDASHQMCRNQTTNETCDVNTFCMRFGAVAGIGFQFTGGAQGGPQSGNELGGSSWNAFAEVGFGAVGAGVSGSTTGGGFSGNIGAVIGVGIPVSAGGMFCQSYVHNCSGNQDGGTPTRQTPPSGPGGDHADDNYSAASPVPPLASGALAVGPAKGDRPQPKEAQDLGFSPPRLVQEPQVGILWNGYAEEAWAYLSSLGWAAEPVLIDFDPASLNLPVMFIPSGGLFGLEGAPSFRVRLEEYASSGGVIIAFAQQQGDEFDALPGGELQAYGWTEDNSCYQASLYISEHHPILAGFSESVLTAGVDGFFTQLPDAGQTLLYRTKNGQPGLILYPYGDGWVVAAALYDDWGASNQQQVSDTKRLLGDTLSWALEPESLVPEFDPGALVSVPLTITNVTALDAALVEISIFEPNGTLYSQHALTLTIPAYAQAGHAVEVLDLTPEAALGIWWVRYELYDELGSLVQPAAWGARFALSDPHPAAGPDKTMGLSITAPTEDFVPGPATFTFHVYNFTDTPRQATVHYGFPHHWVETGDPIYGSGFYGISREVEVSAHGEVTFTHTAQLFTGDRLHAALVQESERQGSWFQIRMKPVNAQIRVNTDQDSYLPGQSVETTITVTNRVAAAYSATLRLTVRGAHGTLLASEDRTVSLPSLGIVQENITFALPPEVNAGTGTVHAEMLPSYSYESISSAKTAFQILTDPLSYKSALPEIYLPETSQSLVVTATNGGHLPAMVSTTLAVTLTDPAGSIQPLGMQTFTVPPLQSQSLEFPFTTPAAQLGVYTFTLSATNAYSQRTWRLFAPNQPQISIHFDQPNYAAREDVTADVIIHNLGGWQQEHDLRVELAAAGYVYTDTVDLTPGGRFTSTHVLSLPDTIITGSHPLTATLAPLAGSPLRQSASLVVPDSRLRVSLIDHSLVAGHPVTLTVTNHGGVDTSGSYSAALSDAFDFTVSSSSGDIPVVLAGSSDWITMTLPGGIVSGDYIIRGVVTNTQTSHTSPFILLVTVDGVEVNLQTTTDYMAYGVGQPILASNQISNTSTYSLEDATLRMTVEGPSSLVWYTHQPGTGKPGFSIQNMVQDTSGIKWMANEPVVTAFDDGGTPLDSADDRWQAYKWPGWQFRSVFVDEAGIKWISAWNWDGNSVLSALDDGGTPFNRSDDRLLQYTAPAEIPAGIISIAQDPTGILWLGDDNGDLSAFDPGTDPLEKTDDQWYQFTSTNSGLVDSWIRQVAVDGDGNVWIATTDGVSVLNYGADPFDAVGDMWHTFDSNNGIPGADTINAIAFEGSDYKWFGGTQDVYVLDDGGTPFDPDGDTWKGFSWGSPCRYPYSLSVDAAGYKWLGSDSCVAVLDTGLDPWDPTDNRTHLYENEYLEYTVLVTLPDGGNLVWFGPEFVMGEGGLSLLDHGGTPFDESDDSWAAFLASDGLGSYQVLDIAAASGGLTWILSEDAGLKAVDQMDTPADVNDDQWFTFLREDISWFGDDATIVEDHFGVVWADYSGTIFALDHGGTLSDTTDDRVVQMDRDYIGGIYNLSGIAIDDANLKWLIGRASGPGNKALLVIDDGGTPITTTDDITMTFALSDTPTGNPESLSIDGAGIKWVVFTGGLLAFDDGGTPFDPNDDQMVTFTSSDGLLSGYISRSAPDDQDRIWIPVESSGVSVLDYNGTLTDKSDDTWFSFQEAEGLPFYGTWTIAIDDQGDKWFGTNQGVLRLDDGGDPFDGLNDTWETYTTTKDLEVLDITVMAAGGDGRIWVGIDKGGAGAAVEQSGVYWSAEEMIDHLPPLGATQILTDIPGLSDTGRYQLKGSLLNNQEQILARDRTPFYVTDGQSALALDAEPDPVRNGETLTVTVSLVNLGSSPVNDQMVTLAQDGAVIDTAGPFDVPTGSSYSYAVAATAPTIGGETVLAASSSGGLETELSVAVAQPVVEFSASAPNPVGVDPFTVTISLSNSGEVAGWVGITLDEATTMVEVPAGGAAVVQQETQACGDVDLAVVLTGDSVGTLNVPIEFGPEVEAAFYPPPAAPVGGVEIPFVLTNTGSVDVSVTAYLTTTGSPQESLDAYLAAGAGLAGSTSFELEAREHLLEYELWGDTCLLAEGQNTFLVAPAVRADIAVTVGTPGTTVPVTATLSNTGFVHFTGTLQLETDDGYTVDSPLSLAVGNTGIYTYSLDAAVILAGTRLVTVTVVTSEEIVAAQDTGGFIITGPDLQLTTLPTQTLLPAGETITLTFGVTNQGNQDGSVELAFSLGDLADEAVVQVVPAGETTLVDFVFFIPPEMETKEYLADYDFNGIQGEFTVTIQGITLSVEAGGDLAAYEQGDSATLLLTVTNQLETVVPDLFALVYFNDITATIPFTLTTSPEVFTFPITATFERGGVVFYGIYHAPSERAIYLNTFRLAQRQPWATVLLDQGVYLPGDLMHATVVSTGTGQLEISAPGFTTTLVLDGANTGFEFVLPSIMERGTYAVNYRLTGCGCNHEGRHWQSWFDVAAPKVRVTNSRLDRSTAFPGDAINLRLTIASDAPIDVILRSYLEYPDGAQGLVGQQALALGNRLDNLVTVSAVMTSTRSGLAFFHYELVDASDETLVRAAGVEAFDAGIFSLLGAATDRTEYITPTLPVSAVVQLYAGQAITGDLSLRLNGEPPQVVEVGLSTGYQSLIFPLDGPIIPGHRILTASFSTNGMTSESTTAFDYGTSLPDLVPSLISLVPATNTFYVPTRTLTLVVSNQGDSPAAGTQAAVYDEGNGGVLIGTALVPPVEADQQVIVEIVWDVTGQGGEHLLKAVIDPVVEFDTANNTVQGFVSLPRLASSMSISSSSIEAGNELAMQVNLENLQGSAILPVTVTLHIDGPASAGGFSESWVVTLSGGEQRFLDAVWATPADVDPGIYFVEVEITTAHNEVHHHRSLFTIRAQEGWNLYIPMLNRA